MIRDLQFCPDGSLRLVSAARDGSIKLWDLNDGGNLYDTKSAECSWVYSVVWSPDGRFIAAVGDKLTVCIDGRLVVLSVQLPVMDTIMNFFTVE